MLQITERSLIWKDTPEAAADMRAAFERDGGIRLPALLDSSLLDRVRHSVARATFRDRVDHGIAAEECMSDNPVLALLYLLMNDSALFEAVRHITGIGRVGCFVGRVYRMRGGTHHFDSWHSDAVPDRLLGMSVNLSPRPYAGGRFELRQVDSDQVRWGVANTRPGDAILFRIDTDLVHRVTAVEGDAAKVSFAGWFQSRPDFLPLLKLSQQSDRCYTPAT